ncbi:MAG: hypothetical protein M1315_01420 [Candidatus Thermoplasmatota archaeon]|nr:hypothetical protein [Candidatus Thermoplasmatota archaeon]
MSLNYDLDLQRSIDFLVQKFSMEEIRSDDPYLLQLYSGDEGAAIQGLRAYTERKGNYFDSSRKKMMPRCEFVELENGHAVVDLIHVFPDRGAAIQRERYIMNRKPKLRRYQL